MTINNIVIPFFMRKFIKFPLISSFTLLICLTSCYNQQNLNPDRYSENIGFDFSLPENGGLSKLSPNGGQEITDNMVLVEGGVFVMGQTQQDVMGGINNSPKTVHVQSFYIDDTEVTNREYLIYLDWLKKVFPPDNPKYKHIYAAAVPNEDVWKNPLGHDGGLSKNYLRHRAFENYPVVGVSWRQANDYCKWRTDRITEKKLMEDGVLKPLYTNKKITVEGRNHFDAEVFETDPKLLFNGDYSIYTEYVTTPEYQETDSVIVNAVVDKKDIVLNIDKHSPSPSYRLPTEVEWEYAAKADVENRFFNSIRGRKKYAWNGESTRDLQSRYYVQHANFKQGKGDYSGIAGWSSDYGDITTPVRSYPPNAFGLYDMAGNVAEWVFDVYRPEMDTNLNDFSYARGNVFRKPKFDENGNVMIATYRDIVYDTLPNGKIVPTVLPGQIIKENISKNDSYLSPNYQRADNRDYADGDLASSRTYLEEDPERRKRMYNAPIIPTPKINEETGKLEYTYDDKPRTTLITNYSRVYKGGSWKDREFWLDPSQRRYLEEYMSTDYIGFRCVVSKVGEGHEKVKRSPFNVSYY
ncbi:gliding motility lipoprotein GldJ [Wenyingzhuangia aestuarii]|uniref:gliding motility lipoprotein GldJ n=1 Tax=Wenyingzhuangia aestuarii TaxID=1647582 RepID=UPI001FD78CE0|nr:gliding motility lipoprotein GldJ [Wenyingzhuangia aestuarii]NJB82630.1 gliding motility-associated lipoprotein GldJ [Wenyingzhuangia aestuarii]